MSALALFATSALGVVATALAYVTAGLPGAPTTPAATLPGSATDLPGGRRPWPVAPTFAVAAAATAAVSVAIAARARSYWPVPADCVFCAAMVTASIVDLAQCRIPRQLVLRASLLGGALLVAAAAATHDWSGLADAAASGAATFAAFLAVHLASRRGLGYGDVRMAGMCGLVVGRAGVADALVATALTFVGAGLVCAALLATRVVTRRSRIPLGPFIAAGAMAVLVWS